MLIRWNVAEERLRELLAFLCRGGQVGNYSASYIILELGAVGLAQALKTLAKEAATPPVGARIEYAVKLYELLKDYRNFYVHGISTIMVVKEWGPTGGIWTTTAKGSVVHHRHFVKVEDIQELTERAGKLDAFCSQIIGHIQCLIDPEYFLRGIPEEHHPPLGVVLVPLPDMPPLPDRLVKQRLPPPQRVPPPPA